MSESVRTGAPLTGQVVVVTGGGSGIGQASVLRLLSDGARVLFGDVRDDYAEETLAAAKALGGEDHVAFVHSDVRQEAEIEILIGAAIDRFGDLTGLVNNAGQGGSPASVAELQVADWDNTFALMPRACFLGTKHAARAMRRLGHGGAVVNIASIAGLTGGAGPLGYSGAKGAVINFTRAAALDLAPRDIRINAVAPGIVVTRATAYRGMSKDELLETEEFFATLQPLQRPGTVADVAGSVAFLLGPDASWITGHTLVVDGGSTVYNSVADRVGEWIGYSGPAQG